MLLTLLFALSVKRGQCLSAVGYSKGTGGAKLDYDLTSDLQVRRARHAPSVISSPSGRMSAPRLCHCLVVRQPCVSRAADSRDHPATSRTGRPQRGGRGRWPRSFPPVAAPPPRPTP